jgi:hypothetical protein
MYVHVYAHKQSRQAYSYGVVGRRKGGGGQKAGMVHGGGWARESMSLIYVDPLLDSHVHRAPMFHCHT